MHLYQVTITTSLVLCARNREEVYERAKIIGEQIARAADATLPEHETAIHSDVGSPRTYN